MIRWETLAFPAASMGEENPLADIGNMEYIHAGYEVTAQVSEEERSRIGRGMIGTIQDNFDRVRGGDHRPSAAGIPSARPS